MTDIRTLERKLLLHLIVNVLAWSVAVVAFLQSGYPTIAAFLGASGIMFSYSAGQRWYNWRWLMRVIEDDMQDFPSPTNRLDMVDPDEIPQSSLNLWDVASYSYDNGVDYGMLNYVGVVQLKDPSTPTSVLEDLSNASFILQSDEGLTIEPSTSDDVIHITSGGRRVLTLARIGGEL
jgi:hypothetical protein